MALIVDVSPTSSNAGTSGISNCVTGRMLSIASPDGESVYVGSYSNIVGLPLFETAQMLIGRGVRAGG